MPSTGHAETRRRKGSKHDKTGCLTCRYRRKKCTDNRFPVCGTCSRLNLKCIRQEVKDVVPDTYAEQKGASQNVAGNPSSPTSPSQSPSPSVVASPPGIATSCYPDSPQKRHAMRYYISVLTNYLTVSYEFNSFLTAFLPMAMESPALFDVLLAFATGHLSLTDESHKVTALETKSTAIRNLAAAIRNPSDRLASYETNAAACLAFVIYEAGVGDYRAWYTHLKGTHHIVMSTSAYSGGKLLSGPEALKTSTEGQWILRNFAYHDVIGSVTLRKKPLLNDDYLEGITDVVDSCIGVAAELLRIVARISCLDTDTALQGRTKDDDRRAKEQQFQSTYTQLEEELHDWDCSSDADPGLVALAHAYRNAALIFLYRLMRSRLSAGQISLFDYQNSRSEAMIEIQAKIQGQVTETLQQMSKIPLGSAPESALLFPVFMAGGEASEQEHMDTIRSRLRLMAKKRQFRNLSQAREVLEDLWDLRKAPHGENADWTQILDASGEDLLLT